MLVFGSLLLFLCQVARAYDVVSVADIEMTLRSGDESDSNNFPAEVMEKTDEFMTLILGEEYGESFEKVSMSIIAEGITAVNNVFVDTTNLRGTAYFQQGTAPSVEEMAAVIQLAFKTQEDVLLETLSSSTDPFLSALVDVDVTVDTSSDGTDKKSSGLETLAVVAIAVSSALFSALVLCTLCICCLGDPEDEEEDDVMDIKKTVSASTAQGSGKTAVSEADHSELDGQSMSDLGTGYGQDSHFEHELRSITSQDSSKFTYNYNPSSDTHKMYPTEGYGNSLDVESWRRPATDSPNASVEVPFGQDISAIGEKELSHVVEVDDSSTVGESFMMNGTDLLSPHERSQATLGTMAGMSAVGIGIADDEELQRKNSKGRASNISSTMFADEDEKHERSLATLGAMTAAGASIAGMSEVGIGFYEDDIEPQQHLNSTEQGLIHDDLDDLEKQVAAHRED